MVGGVSGQRFYARRRLPFLVRNSFQPRLTARFVHEAGGVAAYCSFGLHPLVFAFMVFWFSGAILLGGSLALVCLHRIATHSAQNGDWLGVAIPCLMLAFGAALTGGGWWFSSGDKELLLGSVRRAIEAVPETIKLEG